MVLMSHDKEEMDPSQCRRHLFLFQFVKMGNGKCVFHLSEGKEDAAASSEPRAWDLIDPIPTTWWPLRMP